MDIYRPKDGVYQCINHPDDMRKYIMLEAESCYPTLVPVSGDTMTVEQGSNQLLNRAAVPIPCFSEEDNAKDGHARK